MHNHFKRYWLFSRTALSKRRYLLIAPIIILFLLLSGIAVTLYMPVTEASISHLTCHTDSINVALADGQPEHFHIFGKLCTRNNQSSGIVQVLLHGSTYNHLYWDFPYQPGTYSYVDALTTANYATFNIDRLSDGQSSRPPSNLVSLDVDAYTVHEVIQALRNGKVDGIHFRKVILVGHSLGSNVLWDEAAHYGDIDGAIVTAGLHKVSPGNGQKAFSLVYPATQDPKFRASKLDSGYYTTTPPTSTSPGGRQELFYNTADADPRVISTDEATKDTVIVSEITQSSAPASLANSEKITVPVLTVVGQFDFFQCGPGGTDCSSDQTVQKAEAPYYPHACLEAHILPNSGHDINLHLNAPLWFGMAKQWLDKHFSTHNMKTGQCS